MANADGVKWTGPYFMKFIIDVIVHVLLGSSHLYHLTIPLIFLGHIVYHV